VLGLFESLFFGWFGVGGFVGVGFRDGACVGGRGVHWCAGGVG